MDAYMIGHIVDHLHVRTPRREVIAAVYARIRPDARGADYRARRHEAYREALARHERNRDLYAWVMRGGH